MTSKVIQRLSENIFLILGLVWTLLWIFPWAIWLDSLPWVRLGISIVLFAIPGIIASLFLIGKRLSLLSHFTSGLALSVFLVSSLGVLGRVFHLPFAYIKPVFALIGLIGFLVLSKHSRSEHQLYKPKNFSIVTTVLLLGMIVFGIIMSFESRFGGDDFSSLAYLTNWQHAQPLDFKEVVFDTGMLDTVRSWLAVLPLVQAFLAEMSNISGLLLFGLYLEPYLVAISILAIYNLCEDLLPSEHYAIGALLLQFTFLFILRGDRWQPGIIFFNLLAEDKIFAAFFLAPVFFIAIHHFKEAFTLRSGIFALLIGLSLALTHPVILAYGIFIAGFATAVETLVKREYKKFAVITALLVITVLPSASLRFIPASSKVAFDLESVMAKAGVFNEPIISPVKGTPFYGFNLETIHLKTNQKKQGNPIQVFFSWSYLWLLGLGLFWGIFNLKKNTAAPFIAATSLLVLLCAIPYTGWLVGYAVAARMLWRSVWLAQIGLIGVVLLAEPVRFILAKVQSGTPPRISAERVAFGLILTISLILIGYFSINVYKNRWQVVTQLDGYRNRLESLSTLGDYLEKNIESPSIFVAPPDLMDYLPGISSKAKIVFFRTPAYTLIRVDMDKINMIFSQDTSIAVRQRMNILTKYHIDYIVVEDHLIRDYYASYPDFFHTQEIGNFSILEFRNPEP